MKKLNLYTGNGVSFSPINEEGRTKTDYVRIIADEGKGITNGKIIVTSIDLLDRESIYWNDCDLPLEELNTEENI